MTFGTTLVESYFVGFVCLMKKSLGGNLARYPPRGMARVD